MSPEVAQLLKADLERALERRGRRRTSRIKEDSMRKLAALLCRRCDDGFGSSAQIVPCSAGERSGPENSARRHRRLRRRREPPSVADQPAGREPHPGAGGAGRRPESPAVRETAADRPFRFHTVARAGAERPRRGDGGLGRATDADQDQQGQPFNEASVGYVLVPVRLDELQAQKAPGAFIVPHRATVSTPVDDLLRLVDQAGRLGAYASLAAGSKSLRSPNGPTRANSCAPRSRSSRRLKSPYRRRHRARGVREASWPATPYAGARATRSTPGSLKLQRVDCHAS